MKRLMRSNICSDGLISNLRKVPMEFCLVKFIYSSCHLVNPDVHTPVGTLEGQGDE